MPYRRKNPYHEALISTGEAALITGFEQSTITSWCRFGKLRCYITPGGHYRLRLSDVWAYIYTHYEFKNLEERDPELAEIYKMHMFIFEDMILLSPETVRRVLGEVPPETMVTAMLTCEGIVKKYILSFFPAAEQRALLAKIPALDTGNRAIEAAQFEVIETIRSMMSAGKITVGRPEDPRRTIRENLQIQGLAG